MPLTTALEQLRADAGQLVQDVNAGVQGQGAVEPVVQRVRSSAQGFLDVFRGGTHPESLGSLFDSLALPLSSGGRPGPNGGTVAASGSVTQPGAGGTTNAAQAGVGAAGNARKPVTSLGDAKGKPIWAGPLASIRRTFSGPVKS